MTDAICPLEHRHDPERPRRTAPGARICHGHLRGLRDDLDELPTLHHSLVAHLVNVSTGSDETHRRGPSTGINLNADVVKTRDNIRALLVSWTRIALEEGPWQHAPADNLPAIARWLSSRVDWLADQDWTDELAANLHDTVREARSLVQPNSTYRVELGPCPELVGEEQRHCEGTVIAVMHKATSRETLPDRVLCTALGDDEEEPHAWGPMQWHALGRRMGRTMHASAADAFLRAVVGE